MATPGTPSGLNHSAESQKCGWNVSPRAVSSLSSSLTWGSTQLPASVSPRSLNRKLSSSSSGRSIHAGRTGGTSGAGDGECGDSGGGGGRLVKGVERNV